MISKVAAYVSCDTEQELNVFTIDRSSGSITRHASTLLPRPEGYVATPPANSLSLRSSGAPLATGPDGAVLYAAVGTEPFRAMSYAISPADGTLRGIGEAPIPCSTPFITVDRSGRFLLGAGYNGNQLWVSKIEGDGAITAPPVQIVGNITTPHAVLLHPTNRFAYVAATGHRDILIFDFNDQNGTLSLSSAAQSGWHSAEATPRHLTLHPNGRFLYAINETTSTVDFFEIAPETAALTHIQRVDSRSADEQAGPGLGADLHVSPDGRFLYASERARHTISVYAISPESGQLTPVQKTVAGKIPKSFQITPDGKHLASAGQGTSDLTLFAIDEVGGYIEPVASHAIGNRPIWIELVGLRDGGDS